MNTNIKGTILIILSAFAFGLMPTLSKLSMEEGLNVSSILALRFSIATVLIWAYIFIKKIEYKTDKNHLIYLIIVSVVGYVGTSATYFNSLRYVSSYIAALLLYIYPTLIVVYEIIILKYEKDIRKILALVLSTIGIASIVWGDNINISLLGIILGIGSAFFYALYTIGLQEKRTKEMDSIAVTGYILLFSAISYLSKSLITDTIKLPNSINGYIYIFAFAIISSCFAIFAYCTGVKIIGASRASIISTMEPVFATILGIIIFKEKFTLLSFLGGSLILIAILVLQLNKEMVKKTKD